MDIERSKALEELGRIKDEISALLIEKAQIVKEINVPVYEAKAKAEKIIKEANSEAEITISAANKILAEAQQTHDFAHESLRNTKGELEKVKNETAKLDQAKVDFDGVRFAHENLVRQQRDTSSQIANQNRADAENVQQQLIEVKQREDTVGRCEISVKTSENSLNEQKATLEAKSANLEALQAKLELLEKTLAGRETDLEFNKKVLEGIKAETETIKAKNQAILDDMAERKTDLTRQQNDLARQIEIMDKLKSETEEKIKISKEEQRLTDMKLRKNQEKIDVIEQLRKEEK